MRLSSGETVQVAKAQGAESFLSDPFLFLLIGFFALMYFTVIRPQSRRAKQHRDMLSRLEQGDEVVLSSGLMGTVREIRDHDCRLEISQGVVVSVQKSYISSILPRGTLQA